MTLLSEIYHTVEERLMTNQEINPPGRESYSVYERDYNGVPI